MPPKKKPVEDGKYEINLPDLIKKLSNKPENPEVYTNYVNVAVSSIEITIELYQINPSPYQDPPVTMRFLQRIILPHTLGKAMATALANAIANYEQHNNTKLPNTRQKDEDDKIEIWHE